MVTALAVLVVNQIVYSLFFAPEPPPPGAKPEVAEAAKKQPADNAQQQPAAGADAGEVKAAPADEPAAKAETRRFLKERQPSRPTRTPTPLRKSTSAS